MRTRRRWVKHRPLSQQFRSGRKENAYSTLGSQPWHGWAVGQIFICNSVSCFPRLSNATSWH